MSLSHSPSGFVGSKKTIFQKLFGKVKGAVMALGILSTPTITQASNTAGPQLPPIEERLATAQKMNLESIKSIQELEETIERTWSQLKGTPKAPEKIRDEYGHITTKGLMWIESELPEEYLRKAQKYKNMERELEKMNKKDPKYGAWEYSLICLGGLLIGIIGYKFGKVSKKDLEKLKNESQIAHEEATKHMQARALVEGKNAELEEKIAAMGKAQKMGGRAGEIVDAEFVETRSPDDTLPSSEIPEWVKDTFLAGDTYKEIRNLLLSDLSSDTASQEAKNLQESIEKLSDTTGTIPVKAGYLATMSEKLISYVRFKKISEELIGELLRALEKSFQGQDLYFGNSPVIGQSLDITTMTRVGKVTTGTMIKVTKVLSLVVMGPNTHPKATTKTRAYELAKVNC